jgi:hypothetical protein
MDEPQLDPMQNQGSNRDWTLQSKSMSKIVQPGAEQEEEDVPSSDKNNACHGSSAAPPSDLQRTVPMAQNARIEHDKRTGNPPVQPVVRRRKVFLVALVIVPCLLSFLAAVVNVQLQINEGRKHRTWHYGDAYISIQSASKEIRLHPRSAQLYYQRAWYYLCDNNYDEALRDLDQASTYSSDDQRLESAIDELRKTVLRLKQGRSQKSQR